MFKYSPFIDTYKASNISGGNKTGSKKEVCIEMYNYLISSGVPWYVAVGVLCNIHTRMHPSCSFIDTHVTSNGNTKEQGCWSFGFFGFIVTGQGDVGDELMKKSGYNQSDIESKNKMVLTIQKDYYTKNKKYMSIPTALWTPDKTNTEVYKQNMVGFDVQASYILESCLKGGILKNVNEMKTSGYADCCAATLAVNRNTNKSASKNKISYGEIHARWASAGKDICTWLGFSFEYFNYKIDVMNENGNFKTYESGKVVDPSTIKHSSLFGTITKTTVNSNNYNVSKTETEIGVKIASIVKWLQSQGMTLHGSCGVAGNMRAESNFKTDAIGDNGTSGGLCQWHNERFSELKSFASKKGKEWTSYSVQLEYLMSELNKSNYSGLLGQLKSSNSYETSTRKWGHDFERFKNYNVDSNPEYTKRVNYSKEIYDNISIGKWQAIDIEQVTNATTGTIEPVLDTYSLNNNIDIGGKENTPRQHVDWGSPTNGGEKKYDVNVKKNTPGTVIGVHLNQK